MSFARIEPEPLLVPADPAADPVRSLANARVAIVHYWFVSHRGGERVVESIASMFPQADLFSLVVDPETLPDSLRRRSMQTSFLQNIPGSRRWHRHLLPLYPLALEQFDLSGYDLVISSESGPAKGVLTSAHTCHLCYCHSPMRYLWDFYHRYQRSEGFGRLTRPAFTLASHYLRLWDVASSGRVDYFIANSHNVAARIRKHYRRDAAVVHPPVNVQAGYLADRPSDYYLVVGQLVDYKRIDLAIAASNRLGRRLHVVGAGEQYSRLKKLAGPTIHFCGALSDEELHKQYAHCRALLFPAEEDFGIVPVEALSFGRPVIAFGRGGARETINGFEAGAPNPAVETSSGIFFPEQSPQSLADAILVFESVEHRFSPLLIRQQSERFAPEQFQKKFRHCLAEGWAEFHNGPSRAARFGVPSL
jgi:glycosyltransferase involved in cell wall biosynthesis